MTTHEGRRFSVPTAIVIDGQKHTIKVWSREKDERSKSNRWAHAIRKRIRTIRIATQKDERLKVTTQAFRYRCALLALYDVIEPELNNMKEDDVKKLYDLITSL